MLIEAFEKKKNDLGVKGLNDAPFAKLKSYRPVGFAETEKNQSSDNVDIPSNIKSTRNGGILKKSVEIRKVNPANNTGYKNTFRYLGKIANTSLLQPIEKPKLVNMEMSYASFKKRMSQEKENQKDETSETSSSSSINENENENKNENEEDESSYENIETEKNRISEISFTNENDI